jgi:hypothetical protein
MGMFPGATSTNQEKRPPGAPLIEGLKVPPRVPIGRCKVANPLPEQPWAERTGRLGQERQIARIVTADRLRMGAGSVGGRLGS